MNTKKQRNKDHVKLNSGMFKRADDAMPNDTAVEILIAGGSNTFMKECRRSRDRIYSVEPAPPGNAARKMLKRVREKSFFWLGRQHQRVDRRIRMLTNKIPSIHVPQIKEQLLITARFLVLCKTVIEAEILRRQELKPIRDARPWKQQDADFSIRQQKAIQQGV